MGSSSSSNPRNLEEQPESASYQPKIPSTSTTDYNSSTDKVLETIDQLKLTPCKSFAEQVILCIRNNHGEIMNCIPPIKQYEQCVQDITYERIRKKDYDFDELNSWKF